jgi:hypothetical protein
MSLPPPPVLILAASPSQPVALSTPTVRRFAPACAARTMAASRRLPRIRLKWIFLAFFPLLTGCGTVTNRNFASGPRSAGNFGFAIQVASASGNPTSGNFANAPDASGYDGPAQLPIATVASSMADTPAPGSLISVESGGDLQSALNNAYCGDTIELEAGATFAGSFNLPALNCDRGHWIIVRTSAPNRDLPPEGRRLTPCYAGVASLQGRPQYPCTNPRNVLAKIVLTGAGTSAVTLLPGANHLSAERMVIPSWSRITLNSRMPCAC